MTARKADLNAASLYKHSNTWEVRTSIRTPEGGRATAVKPRVGGQAADGLVGGGGAQSGRQVVRPV